MQNACLCCYNMDELKYPFPVKYLNIHEGIDIAFCDEGQGEQTILFIHGLGNYLPVWKQQIVSLKTDVRCVAIDLPGNGLSSKGDFPFSMFFYAECVAKFIEKLNLKNLTVCGHSMGGQIAIIMSLRYPHLIENMVLVAPAGIENFTKHEAMLMQQTMSFGDYFYSDEYHIESAIKQSFFKSENESSGIIADIKKIMKAYKPSQWREMSVKSVKGMLNEQVTQFLPEIKCPVKIIFGEKDMFIPNTLMHPFETPESVAKYGTSKILQSEYVMVKNAGHFVQIEAQSTVNKEILLFLNAQQNG